MKQILYLGLELPLHLQKKSVVHCPFIRIIPKAATDKGVSLAFEKFEAYTHLIFTSKSAVSIFFDLAPSFKISREEIRSKTLISVGQKTALKLKEKGMQADLTATKETAEGIVETLMPLNLENAHLFLPQSSIARPVIIDWLAKQGIAHTACPIYQTLPNHKEPLPDLSLFDQIIFTSPSTVDSFIQAYGALPSGKTLTCIGPVTKRHLHSILKCV